MQAESVVAILLLSLWISLLATALAAVVGLPAAACLALARFPGRHVLVVLAHLLLGMPPVVVGLAVYRLLIDSRSLLFTPAGMVLAQAALALPIVVAFGTRVLAARWRAYGRAYLSCGAGRLRALPSLLAMSRAPLAAVVLAAFGRIVAELGAVLAVGGNIAGQTRTMTTAIMQATAAGRPELGVPLALVLSGITLAVSAAVLLLTARRAGA